MHCSVLFCNGCNGNRNIEFHYCFVMGCLSSLNHILSSVTCLLKGAPLAMNYRWVFFGFAFYFEVCFEHYKIDVHLLWTRVFLLSRFLFRLDGLEVLFYQYKLGFLVTKTYCFY
nr:hypothetical protein [uncultured bacterium]